MVGLELAFGLSLLRGKLSPKGLPPMRTLILLGVIAVSVTGFSQDRSKYRAYNVRGDIATDDLRAIESLVGKLDQEPILGIGTAKDGTVTVTTGVVRGHLSGGG